MEICRRRPKNAEKIASFAQILLTVVSVGEARGPPLCTPLNVCNHNYVRPDIYPGQSLTSCMIQYKQIGPRYRYRV